MVTMEQLAKEGLFEGLATHQLQKVVDLAEERSYADGTMLFKHGSPATHMFILVEGKIAIQVVLSTRPDPITTTVLSKQGQLVGWSGFMSSKTYTASAICQANSRLLVIDGAALMSVLEHDPAMGFVIMRRVAEVISLRLRNMQSFVLTTL